jgi:hypothetical protein
MSVSIRLSEPDSRDVTACSALAALRTNTTIQAVHSADRAPVLQHQ